LLALFGARIDTIRSFASDEYCRVWFEVVVIGDIKIMTLWDVRPYSFIGKCHCFEESAAFIMWLEYRYSRFLQNVAVYLQTLMKSHPKQLFVTLACCDSCVTGTGSNSNTSKAG
jgi:hypothetical protein